MIDAFLEALVKIIIGFSFIVIGVVLFIIAMKVINDGPPVHMMVILIASYIIGSAFFHVAKWSIRND